MNTESTPRAARFEIVRTTAGFHGRFRAANGRIVWSTEVYRKRVDAVHAVELIAGASVLDTPYGAWPEISWQGNLEWPTEVRDVDERAL